jgi:hypothetical protein
MSDEDTLVFSDGVNIHHCTASWYRSSQLKPLFRHLPIGRRTSFVKSH